MKRLLVALSLVGLWGCGGDGGGQVQVYLPLADFCPQWINGLKQQQLRCGRAPLTAEDAAALSELCEAYVVRGVEAGVVTYDGQEATRCLLAQRQSCEDLLVSCAAFQGLQGEGEACYSDIECTQGECTQEDQCPGQCAQTAPPGGSCEVLECDRDGVCTEEGFCARRAARGEGCISTQDCAQGLHCLCDDDALCDVVQYDPPRRGRCEPPPPLAREGDPCPPGRFCAEGLACITPFGAPFDQPGLCLPQVDPGERCTVGGEDLAWFDQGCRGGLCQTSEGDFEGLCVLTQEGAPCITWAVQLEEGGLSSGQDCGPGLFCDAQTSRCAGEPKRGDELPTLGCVRP
jgi:hypothetical protein